MINFINKMEATSSSESQSQTKSNLIHSIPKNKLFTIDVIDLTPEQEAAALCFIRRDRFVEGSNYVNDLIVLLNEYFGDLNALYKTGLDYQYKCLKTRIETDNLIGLILAGINMVNTVINRYTPANGENQINLTIASLCRTFLRNNFSQLEVNTLAKATPNYNIYYEHAKNNGVIKKGRFNVKTFIPSPPRQDRTPKSRDVLAREAKKGFR